MGSMAVAIDGLSGASKTCWRLSDIVGKIHEATHRVNEVSFLTSPYDAPNLDDISLIKPVRSRSSTQLKLMIDVAFQIEKYVQKLLNSTHDD